MSFSTAVIVQSSFSLIIVYVIRLSTLAEGVLMADPKPTVSTVTQSRGDVYSCVGCFAWGTNGPRSFSISISFTLTRSDLITPNGHSFNFIELQTVRLGESQSLATETRANYVPWRRHLICYSKTVEFFMHIINQDGPRYS